MVREEFLTYDYYYSIPCHQCGTSNPALDYAEYAGMHPLQIGDLQAKRNLTIWMPKSDVILKPQEFPHCVWGSERIRSLGKRPDITRIESLDEYTPKSTWDAMAALWVEHIRGDDEYHHTYKILPEVFRLLDAQENEVILDVACGEGTVARNLAKCGAKVTGIDISKMLDFAIEEEERANLGIRYLNLNAENLNEEFEMASFDKVVCNMALMDFEDFRPTINQISSILKEDGIFVFSILHPAFSWPAFLPVRIPADSERNEDRIRFITNYFDERPTIIKNIYDLPPMLHFHRPLSSYLNELAKNNLMLTEVTEPQASEELVQKFPRRAYMDDDTYPDFLIVKAVKKSNPKLK